MKHYRKIILSALMAAVIAVPALAELTSSTITPIEPNLTPTKKTYYISAHAFEPRQVPAQNADDCQLNTDKWFQNWYDYPSSRTCFIFAPLLLPSGTVITAIKSYYEDPAGSACSVTTNLYEGAPGGVDRSILSSTSTDGSTSTSFSLTTPETLGNNFYFFKVTLGTGPSSAGGCQLQGIKVTVQE